ncbi:MAG TPA: hypothetical protein VE569_13245 [Acidimicrobiia bacterium]|nr:hypothetical protein [Acidimicrobiia bacterium]
MLSFDQDGRYWQDSGGALAHNPDMVATYEVEGNHVQLEVTSSSISECEAGATGAFRASAVGSALTIEWIEHSCYPEASGLVWEATRLGPDNALVAPLPETIPTNTYPVREGNLRGVWIVDGTSLLFELDGAGHYFLDTSGTLASAPEESGTYAVNVDDDSLELDTVQSGMCRSGDRLIFSDASAFTTAQILRAIAAVATDECGRVQGDTILALVSS